MVERDHLSPKVVRSTVTALGDWDGLIKFIQNTGRYIENKLPWRRAYGWVLIFAGMRKYIPEDERHHYDRDRFSREGMHAYHCWGMMPQDWTKDIILPPPPGLEDSQHHEDPRREDQPEGWRRPKHDRQWDEGQWDEGQAA